MSGLRGKGAATLLLAPFKVVQSIWQSLQVIRKRNPVVVLGCGGFVAGPGGVAAWLTRRPLVIHEQNAVAGMTNRMLAKLARRVLEAFPKSFPSGTHAEQVGNPVRREIAAIAPPAQRFADRTGPMRLLIIGGSQGAMKLNATVPAALATIDVGVSPCRDSSGR